MRWYGWLFLAGCNRILGLETTKLIDSPPVIDARPDAPGCSGSVFANPQPVAGSAFGDMGDPGTTEDPNELWFTSIVASGLYIEIATRTSESAPFDTVTSFSTSPGDNDPALSADGLVLVFQSSRLGPAYVFECRRTSRGAPWSAPVQIAPIGQSSLGIDLSFDGNTLYYVDGDGLRMLERASRDDAWQARPEILAPPNINFPGVSPDGLELYYYDNNMIYRRLRTSTISAFGAAELIVSGQDPELTTDSRHLYVDVNQRPVVLSRTCN